MKNEDIKLQLTRLIGDIENQELINKIKIVLTEEQGDFWDSLSDDHKDEMRKCKGKDND